MPNRTKKARNRALVELVGDIMRAYLLPIVCVVALAGCGRNQDQQHNVTVSGNGGTVSVSGNGEHMTIKDTTGKESVEINSNGGGVPANLPDFVPVYPGAKVTSSVVGNGNNGNGGMIIEQTNASISDVIAFYKQKSAASGFVEAMNMNTGGTTMFTATSSDKKKSINVVASTSNGSTQAQITWGTN